jgi:hypothetical protein
VIEWGLEAYGVNAAGSEPSNEVSVVIWPGERPCVGLCLLAGFACRLRVAGVQGHNKRLPVPDTPACFVQ